MERGYRFQSGGYGTGEYFESGESEVVYPFKKITYRESEQQQQHRTDLSASSAESFSSFSESFRRPVWRLK